MYDEVSLLVKASVRSQPMFLSQLRLFGTKDGGPLPTHGLEVRARLVVYRKAQLETVRAHQEESCLYGT